MHPLANILDTALGILTIVANIASIAIVAAIVSPKLRESAFAKIVADKALAISFLVSLIATLGSLTYSDVIGYAPCVLCWFQRIFMYPLVVLLGIALWKRDLGIHIYAIALSVIGGAISLYHYLGQNGVGTLPCEALGYSVSCAREYVLTFGYITIPVMALSAFVLIALVLGLSLKRGEKAVGSRQ